MKYAAKRSAQISPAAFTRSVIVRWDQCISFDRAMFSDDRSPYRILWRFDRPHAARQSVRRQRFWDRRRLKIRESLAPLVCNIKRLADGAASGDCRLSFV